MRTAFVSKLSMLAQRDDRVLLLTGDLGFKIFDDFRQEFPEQFLNMGVAEANMISVAAGLAMEGRKPVVYSLASFLTMRAYEHIRNDICFHRAKVVMVAAGGGFSYGHNGPSHHALTDIALMRALPEMRVLAPADRYESDWAVQEACEGEGPAYIRLGRGPDPDVHDGVLQGCGIRQGVMLREGQDIAVIVSGFILPLACQAVDRLIEEGYSVRLISLPSLKPLVSDLVRDAFEQCSKVFTVEEHSIVGGLFSAVMEMAVAKGLRSDKLCPIAVEGGTIHETGSPEYLRQRVGLHSAGILQRIKEKVLC